MKIKLSKQVYDKVLGNNPLGFGFKKYPKLQPPHEAQLNLLFKKKNRDNMAQPQHCQKVSLV